MQFHMNFVQIAGNVQGRWQGYYQRTRLIRNMERVYPGQRLPGAKSIELAE